MADPRERYQDGLEHLRAHADGHQAGLWTALPGIIQSYQPGAQTVSVQPAIKAGILKPDGTTSQQALPLLVDVPVQFPSGAGHTLTFPIAAGDECLVVFSSRCIDGWWQNGGTQSQPEARMHDLSDGFAVLGFRSQPRVLMNVSTASTQLRSNDGTSFFDFNATAKTTTTTLGPGLTVALNGTAKSATFTVGTVALLLDGAAGTIGMTAPNGIVQDAPTVAATGNVIGGFGGADQVTLQHHTHPTANPGGPSQPTPGT